MYSPFGSGTDYLQKVLDYPAPNIDESPIDIYNVNRALPISGSAQIDYFLFNNRHCPEWRLLFFMFNNDSHCETTDMHRYTHKPHLLSEVSRTAYRYGNAHLIRDRIIII